MLFLGLYSPLPFKYRGGHLTLTLDPSGAKTSFQPRVACIVIILGLPFHAPLGSLTCWTPPCFSGPAHGRLARSGGGCGLYQSWGCQPEPKLQGPCSRLSHLRLGRRDLSSLLPSLLAVLFWRKSLWIWKRLRYTRTCSSLLPLVCIPLTPLSICIVSSSLGDRWNRRPGSLQ